MSRTLYLTLDEGKVVACCLKEKVGISTIERLPGGGVRLVCNGTEGAAKIRKVLKKDLIEDQEVARERHRPSTPLW
jgi:hypothetical protein